MDHALFMSCFKLPEGQRRLRHKLKERIRANRKISPKIHSFCYMRKIQHLEHLHIFRNDFICKSRMALPFLSAACTPKRKLQSQPWDVDMSIGLTNRSPLAEPSGTPVEPQNRFHIL